MRAWEECVFIADRLFGFSAVDPERDSNGSYLMNKAPADGKTTIDNDMGKDTAITYSSPRSESATANIVSSDHPYARNAASSELNNDIDEDRNKTIANSKFPIIVLKDITHKFLKRNKTELQKNAPPVNVNKLRMTRAMTRKIDPQVAERRKLKAKENLAVSATEPRYTRAMKRKIDAQAACSDQPRKKKNKKNE